MTTKKQREKQEAIDHLKTILKPGDTVYTTVQQVSRSGMSRNITVRVIRDNEPWNISYYVAKATEHSLTKDNDVRIGGCGMDMGFQLVYLLSHAIFNDGYALKQRWM